MTNKKTKIRNKPILYPERINAKITEEQKQWYQDFAKLENINISELLRLIPNIYDKMDIDVDILGDEIITLKKVIIDQKELIQALRNDSKGYKKFKEMYNKPNKKELE